jgi:hypothetical protein
MPSTVAPYRMLTGSSFQNKKLADEREAAREVRDSACRRANRIGAPVSLIFAAAGATASANTISIAKTIGLCYRFAAHL